MTDRLSKEQIVQVAVACERLAAKAVLTSGAALSEVAPDVAVLVSALRAGERHIPEDHHHWLTASGTSASLLLLCDEPLVRPSVSLHSGRVVLLGGNSTAESIASRLRVLIAERSMSEGGAPKDERAYPAWWSRDTRRECAETRIAPEEHGGFVQLFSLSGPLVLAPEAFAAIRAAARREALENVQLDDDIRQRAGDEVAIFQYSPATQEWIFHWPAGGGVLWLLSPTRLPVLSDLSRVGQATRMQASSGDVLVALSGAGPSPAPELTREVVARAEDGGPGVFDVVSENLRSRPEAWATVAELR